ncbi:Hypothetical predicted protein [Lecanosticta acicola]|uniref:Uncharacterized protein n=1 Tax=Lecanosticta acicola TaxID=111012 RepID=A0AAI8Z6D6_9PEZI|nr:Hypothetical predicted protein [Lecanosticta acicola]
MRIRDAPKDSKGKPLVAVNVTVAYRSRHMQFRPKRVEYPRVLDWNRTSLPMLEAVKSFWHGLAEDEQARHKDVAHFIVALRTTWEMMLEDPVLMRFEEDIGVTRCSRLTDHDTYAVVRVGRDHRVRL